MRSLFTSLFVTICFYGSSQQYDYLAIRDTIRPALCGWRDSLSLTEIVPKMLALDTNILTTETRYNFFSDLAMEEYMYYGYMLDTNLLNNSIRHNQMALYHRPEAFSCYWDIAICYSLLGDCDNKLYWLALYEQHLPRRFLKKRRDEIAFQRQKCQ
jgi:hypothetical protein